MNSLTESSEWHKKSGRNGVRAPRDNHLQYLIISPHNHTLLQTKHALSHIKLSRDKLFLVVLVSAITSFTGPMASHLTNGD